MRPGQVCRIDRFSKTAVSTPYYRICTPKWKIKPIKQNPKSSCLIKI
jgi:hypothetical protein